MRQGFAIGFVLCPPQNKDGHLNKCRECTKEDVRVHRIRNPEKIREYEARRNKLPQRIASARRHTDEWAERHPEWRHAHYMVNNAVRDGKLSKPSVCDVCGREGRLHAHHYDYSKPLEVIWVCPKCHRDIHAEEVLAEL